jgi:hypothetical protein
MTIGIADALLALTPGAQWVLKGETYAGLEWLSTDIAKPTEAEVDAEIAVLTAEQPFTDCKNEASKLLYETDWTTIPDVADPTKSDPYLTNQAAFVSYRSNLRKLAVNPVADPVWPILPIAQWSA